MQRFFLELVSKPHLLAMLALNFPRKVRAFQTIDRF
jgi:hypothetical protein